MKIVLLHPGAMGASVGAALQGRGHEVAWVTQDRSDATKSRAAKAGLAACTTLAEAVTGAGGVISVCPPDQAETVAIDVHAAGFAGAYVDANAVAPSTARRVAAIAGDKYVDGGIVGPPAWRAGTTRLYLSGAGAPEVASWFDESLVDARVVGEGLAAASALKMCYAAYTKGTSALLLAIRALADAENVTAGLLDEWALSQPGLDTRSDGAARGTGPKAWRFEGEMREIATTFREASLPGEFHDAAAEVYRRMRGFKDASAVDVGSVIEALRNG